MRMLLGERVDARGPVAAQHVRQRDLGVGLRDPRRVEVDRRPAVGRLDAAPCCDLVDDRLRDDVARAERVGELLALGVQQHGAVRPRRLRDRVALQVRGPRAAVRVVLERIEIARLGAEIERHPRHLAGRIRMVRRELAALLRLGEAAAPGASTTVPASIVCSPQTARQPVAVGSRLCSGAFSNDVPEPPSQASRSPFVIAWPVRSPTWSSRFCEAPPQLREPVAAVLARELDPELLEPVDRVGRLARQDLDEAAVGGLVGGAPDVLGVLLGRVLGAERGLDPALRLRGVVRLQRALRRDGDPRARALGGDCGGEARRPRCRSRARRSRPRRS